MLTRFTDPTIRLVNKTLTRLFSVYIFALLLIIIHFLLFVMTALICNNLQYAVLVSTQYVSYNYPFVCIKTSVRFLFVIRASLACIVCIFVDQFCYVGTIRCFVTLFCQCVLMSVLCLRVILSVSTSKTFCLLYVFTLCICFIFLFIVTKPEVKKNSNDLNLFDTELRNRGASVRNESHYYYFFTFLIV